MRLFFLALVLTALGSQQPVAAQRVGGARPPKAAQAPARLPAPARPAKPARLACALAGSQVFDANGQPLAGATLLVKGTQRVYVTDANGQFQFTDPVYQGQVLVIDAAGYTTREVSLTDCTLPRLVLDQAPGARIKRSGKRAGKVIRLGKPEPDSE